MVLGMFIMCGFMGEWLMVLVFMLVSRLVLCLINVVSVCSRVLCCRFESWFYVLLFSCVCVVVMVCVMFLVVFCVVLV